MSKGKEAKLGVLKVEDITFKKEAKVALGTQILGNTSYNGLKMTNNATQFGIFERATSPSTSRSPA